MFNNPTTNPFSRSEKFFERKHGRCTAFSGVPTQGVYDDEEILSNLEHDLEQVDKEESEEQMERD